MLKQVKVILTLLVSAQLFGQSLELNEISNSKQGGICFRVDDNRNIYDFLQFGSVFEKHGFNFTFALNLGQPGANNNTFIAGVKQLQNAGHEMLDHTPGHRTNYFQTIFNLSDYSSLPGVHHLGNQLVYLTYEEPDLSDASFIGSADIYSDYLISNTNGAFKDLRSQHAFCYLLPSKTFVFIHDIKNLINSNQDTIFFDNFWNGQDIDLGVLLNEEYYIFSNDNVHMTTEAFEVLANETLKMADYYGYERPVSWIQPGGNNPRAHKNELKSSIGDKLGYKSAAVYPDNSIKTFNEYNPNFDKKYGMQWADFMDDCWELSWIKAEIADVIAKHRMMIGHSHFTSLLGGWEGYIDRVDQLLQWCKENNIPVLTYKDMADILYESHPNPYINIVPPLNIDLDLNGVPDGYNSNSFEYDWVLDKTELIPESGDYSFLVNHEGGVCYIEGLGGIEKNHNDFSIWIKGESGNFIEVIFSWEATELIYKFPTDNNQWNRYSLNQSINGNTELFIPEEISLINIEVRCSDYISGDINIGGMSLSKMNNDNFVFADIKIFLEGAYSTTENIINPFIPLSQPYDTFPWNYQGDECIEFIPINMLDWVLVELRDETDTQKIISKRAALLLQDGKIVDLNGIDPLKFNVENGKYYIAVKHRNHISVLSSTPQEL